MNKLGWFDSWLDFGLFVLCWGLIGVIFWECVLLIFGWWKVIGFFSNLKIF